MEITQSQNIFLNNDRTNKKKDSKIKCWLFSPFIFLASFDMGGFLIEIASQDFDMR